MSLRNGISTQALEQLNKLFQDKWGEDFEDALSYPVWNYFLSEYPARFKEDYFNTIYTDLKERFELLGAHVEVKTSGIHSNKEAKKKIKESYLIDDQIKIKLFNLKEKMNNKLKIILEIGSKNHNIGNVKKIIDNKIALIVSEVIDDIGILFKGITSEMEEAGYILHCLSYLQAEFDAKKYPHYLELIEKIIEKYKQQKLNNEIKIFSERNPTKINIKVGDRVSEIYTSNLIVFLQEEFSKNLAQFNRDNIDIFSKKEKVVRFARKIAQVLDFMHSDEDLSAALLYLIDAEKLKLTKKEAFFTTEKDLLLSPPRLIMDVRDEESSIKKVREMCHAGNKINPVQEEKKTGFYLSSSVKTGLYIAGGILLGVGMVTAFVLGGGLPLLLGFLAIHLIHIAPLALKLMLVVGGMLLGGGLGYGGKKVVEGVEDKGGEEVVEDPYISAPLEKKTPQIKMGLTVSFDAPQGTASLGVFAKTEARPLGSVTRKSTARAADQQPRLDT